MTTETKFIQRIEVQNWILLAAVVAVGLGLVFLSLKHSERPSTNPAWVYPEFYSCEKDVLNDLHQDKVNLILLQNVAQLCSIELRDQSAISIFEVNRDKYIEQNYEDRILLWMVVAITISGVLLAGLQLFASFKLASEGKAEFARDSDITIEKDRLSLRSSVTGLLILIISLAFFIVYVKYVYKIDDPSNINTSALQQPQSSGGGDQRSTKPTTGAPEHAGSGVAVPAQPPIEPSAQ